METFYTAPVNKRRQGTVNRLPYTLTRTWRRKRTVGALTTANKQCKIDDLLDCDTRRQDGKMAINTQKRLYDYFPFGKSRSITCRDMTAICRILPGRTSCRLIFGWSNFRPPAPLLCIHGYYLRLTIKLVTIITLINFC